MDDNIHISNEVILKEISDFNKRLLEVHENHENDTGFEINDRSIFINTVLKSLGHNFNNILNDVSQNLSQGVKRPDIRIYADYEMKNKNNHSQFIIETKNYGLFMRDSKNIDFLQLKRYIKANESKIRVICCTDYVSMYIFNASEIKKKSGINLNKINSISKYEEELFIRYLYGEIYFNFINDNDLKILKKLSYMALFKKHVFINPVDFDKTNSISNYGVRQNFRTNLYNVVNSLKEDIEPDLLESLKTIETLNTEGIKNKICKSFFLWGYEMNYIENIFINVKVKSASIDIFVKNKDNIEAFLLTSIYSLINKTFFLRCLEDLSTDNTKFVYEGYNNRYLSDGILNKKLKEGEKELIQYLKNVYEFKQTDLKQYSYILKKDIYSWVLDYISPYNLLNFIRLFNDISFKKLNQDILGDIYEHYLEGNKDEGDKSYRYLLGQFYTPKPIVRFMWQLTREVLRNTKGRDLYDKGSNYLDILDMSYGSGSFLYEGILQINQCASNKPINNGIIYATLKDRNVERKVEEHMYGFEINPLSKSIADINIFIALIQLYGTNGEQLKTYPIEKIRLFRTNSYDLTMGNKTQQEKLLIMGDDADEAFKERKEIIDSKNKKYDIIITNPPYGVQSPTKFVKKELIPFMYPENNFDKEGNEIDFTWDNIGFKGNVPDDQKNKGKIRDMYASFMGIADHLSKENGIITLITSNTYLSIPTYKWFRKYIIQNYKIHYIINFNKISERGGSMFLPEASIGTAIIVMTKEKSCNNKFKYLDLSNVPEVIDKYRAICQINKNNGQYKNKNAIEAFSEKNIKTMPFIEIEQSKILNRKGYIINYSQEEILLEKIEKQSVELSYYGNLNAGVGPGDVNYLVDETIEGLKGKIHKYVFSGDLSKLNKTSRDYIEQNIRNGRLIRKLDESKIVKFIFQKHMEKYYYEKYYYIYHDRYVIWRARLHKNDGKESILNKYKLFLVEDRNNGKFDALIVNELVLPQDGGRFNYIIPSEKTTIDDLYCIAAIINSDVIQFFYKSRMQGNKDIPVKKLSQISLNNKGRLAILSKELHELKKDNYNLINANYKFASKWFKENVNNQLETFNVLEENKYWAILLHSSLPEYIVNKAAINGDIVKLNSTLDIKFRDGTIAKSFFEFCIRNYSGDLLEHPLIINVTEVLGNNKYPGIISLANNKISDKENEINNLVSNIYNLDDSEKIKVQFTMLKK